MPSVPSVAITAAFSSIGPREVITRKPSRALLQPIKTRAVRLADGPYLQRRGGGRGTEPMTNLRKGKPVALIGEVSP